MNQNTQQPGSAGVLRFTPVLSNVSPDVVLAGGSPNEMRISPSGITCMGKTITDAGEAYTAFIRAMNGYLPHPAAPSPQVAEELPPVDYDKDMDRHYIPLPGGWEVQTKGKGSTFRIAHGPSDRRWLVLDDNLHQPLVAMASGIRAAIAASRRASPSLPDVAMPEHLREFVQAVADNYTGMDNQERLLCYGCDADIDDHEDHKPDCIVLRAKALLAAQPAEGSAQVATSEQQDQVKCDSALRAEPAVIDWPPLPTPETKVTVVAGIKFSSTGFSDKHMQEYGQACVDAATRCRAEGGNTCDKGNSEFAAEGATPAGETRSLQDMDIDAAEEQAALYDDDDRGCIKVDVMNAFFAGIRYERARIDGDKHGEQGGGKA